MNFRTSSHAGPVAPPLGPPRAGGPADPEELGALLVEVGRGDRAAFKALYDATAPKLFGLILRIVRDRAVAEEVLQDAFLRIWGNASTYSPGAGRPVTWLASIARHRAIDVVRRRTEVLLADGEDGEDWLARIMDPRNAEADLADRDALRSCLGRIEEEHARCLLLAYHEGYSREELATRFGRPVNTIKTWLHRSLAALRQCLDER